MPSSAQATAEPISPPLRLAEEPRRVGHAGEAGAGHLEDADLVRRPETVLDRAQDAVLAVAVALELEHAVDEVLEDARAGHGTVLRHVADEEDGDSRLLGDAQEPRGRLAHLSDGARRRAELGRVERLDRVDHADVGPRAIERRADGLELGLGKNLDRAAPPRRSARSFTCAADSSPVTSSARRSADMRAAPSGAASTCRRRARRRRARATPVRAHRRGHGRARGRRSGYARSAASTSTRRSSGRAAATGRRVGWHAPRRASRRCRRRAFAEPACRRVAALGAGIENGCLGLGHVSSLGTASDAGPCRIRAECATDSCHASQSHRHRRRALRDDEPPQIPLKPPAGLHVGAEGAELLCRRGELAARSILVRGGTSPWTLRSAGSRAPPIRAIRSRRSARANGLARPWREAHLSACGPPSSARSRRCISHGRSASSGQLRPRRCATWTRTRTWRGAATRRSSSSTSSTFPLTRLQCSTPTTSACGGPRRCARSSDSSTSRRTPGARTCMQSSAPSSSRARNLAGQALWRLGRRTIGDPRTRSVHAAGTGMGEQTTHGAARTHSRRPGAAPRARIGARRRGVTPADRDRDAFESWSV